MLKHNDSKLKLIGSNHCCAGKYMNFFWDTFLIFALNFTFLYLSAINFTPIIRILVTETQSLIMFHALSKRKRPFNRSKVMLRPSNFVRHPSVQWGTLWHSLYLHDKICHLHFVASLCTVLLQMFRGISQRWLTWTVIHILLACMDWTVWMKFDFA